MVAAERAQGDVEARGGVEAVLDDGGADTDAGRGAEHLEHGQGAVGDAQVSDAVRDVGLNGGPGLEGLVQGGERGVEDERVDVGRLIVV